MWKNESCSNETIILLQPLYYWSVVVFISSTFFFYSPLPVCSGHLLVSSYCAYSWFWMVGWFSCFGWQEKRGEVSLLKGCVFNGRHRGAHFSAYFAKPQPTVAQPNSTHHEGPPQGCFKLYPYQVPTPKAKDWQKVKTFQLCRLLLLLFWLPPSLFPCI